MISFKATLQIIFSFLIIISCCKEEATTPAINLNTTAKITIEKTTKTIEEGDDLIFGISLSEKINKEIAVELQIISDTVVNFINSEDYKSIFAFSADQGKTWTDESSRRITIPKETKEVQVRLQTLDDHHLEVHEDLYIEIKINTPEGITLSGDLNVIKKTTLLDNEKEIVTTEENWFLDPVTLIYRTNDDYTEFKLIKMVRRAVVREEKILLDKYISEGLPYNDQKTIRNLYKGGPFHVREIGIHLGLDSTSWAAEVTSDGAFGEWSIVFGSFYVYYFPKNDHGNYIELDFPINSDPEYQKYAYLEIHEYGHVISLDSSILIHDETSNDPRIPPVAGCPDLLSFAGCVDNRSLYAQFFNAFYFLNENSLDPIPKNNLIAPAFVSDYAASHFIEDLAESYTYYVVTKDLPPPTEDSSGAYRKIHFFTKFPEIEAHKQKMWAATGGFIPLEFSYGQTGKSVEHEKLRRHFCHLHQHGDWVLDVSF